MSSKIVISEIAEIIMGQSPKKKDVNEIGNGYPLLNGPTEFTERYPEPVQFTTDGKRFSDSDDILFCVRGSTTGRMNYADQPYAIGRGIAAIRGKDGYPTPFVRAVIENNLYRLLAAATGSTFPNVSKSLLNEFEVEVISAVEAQEANEIIVSIENKIHLNQQTNETLEAMAQAIFKSWFVDFDPVRAKIEAASADRDPNRAAMAAIVGVTIEQDWDAIEAALQQKLDRMSDEQRTQLRQIAELFPDELVESEIGMVPKGWEYSTIGKEFDIVNGQSPPGSSYNEEGEGSPFYQGRTDFGFRFPTQRVYCTEPKRFAKKGDTLLSVRAPVGDLNIAIEDCCIGRGIASLRHKSGSVSYTYYAMKQVQAQIEAYEATGTVFGSINQKQLKALDTIAPDRKVINEFHRIADPIDSKVMNQAFMNRELSKLRDTLLPKLISGEVGV